MYGLPGIDREGGISASCAFAVRLADWAEPNGVTERTTDVALVEEDTPCSSEFNLGVLRELLRWRRTNKRVTANTIRPLRLCTSNCGKRTDEQQACTTNASDQTNCKRGQRHLG